MTCYPTEVVKPGELVIHYKPKDSAAKDFIVHYNSAQMQPTIEKVPLTAMEDKGIVEKWGDNIYRINFNVISPKTTEKMSFTVAVK